jgi:hypothetical protein
MFIPLRIRLLHNFGRSSFIIGFLFALIGLAFIVYFSFQLNWKILFADNDDFSPAVAYITGWEKAPYNVNDNPLSEYYYSYSVNQNTLSGSFLEFAETYNIGKEIRIEYLTEYPEVSRFTGKDRRNYDQIMFLGGIGGLLFGFFFLYPSIRKTRRERKILIAGIPSKGKLIHAEPTNLNVNEQTVYNLTYEYSTGQDKTQVFSVRSHMIRNLSEEHHETIVYDPRKPSSAIIVDTLPGSVARYVNKKLEHSRI